MNFKIVIILPLLLASLSSLTSCEKKIKETSFNETNIKLDVGDDFFLYAYYYPARKVDSLKDIKFVWSITNLDVIQLMNGWTLDDINLRNDYAINFEAISYGETQITLDIYQADFKTTLVADVIVSDDVVIKEENKVHYDKRPISQYNSHKHYYEENSFHIGDYETGNYSDCYSENYLLEAGSYGLEYYRATKNEYNVMTLLPYFNNPNDHTIPGAFYNTFSYNFMDYIYLNYHNLTLSSVGFVLSLSYDGLNWCEYEIVNSLATKDVWVDASGYRYFKIATSGAPLSINYLEISNVYNDCVEREYLNEDDELYRVKPTKYSGELISGVSSVNVPIKTELVDGKVKVIESKEYTYYSQEYLLQNLEDIDQIALTNYQDVINYFLAFSIAPPNYSYEEEMIAYFGTYYRRISDIYSRTDGYVNALPINQNNLFYVELDVEIGLNNYIVNNRLNRGVGRIIIFFNGFDSSSYQGDYVAIFTDDHYATFFEYYNNGFFSHRFNAQTNLTKYCYQNVATYEIV